jgi:hypothetical protein
MISTPQNDQSLYVKCYEKIDQVNSLCQELRDYLIQLKELKKERKTELNDDDMKFLTRGHLLFLKLRAAHREACAMNDSLNSRRFEFQTQTDSMSLRLSNLQYEAYNLHQQIHACKQFYSRHIDIPLVPLDEFMKNAPDDLKQTTDDHKLMLNRLQFELQERKRLEFEIEQLKEKKTQVKQQISDKKNFIQGLKGSLQSIREQAVSIQKYMVENIPPKDESILVENEVQEIERARTLPFPLYDLFNKLDIYRKQYPKKIQVSIQEHTKIAASIDQQSLQTEKLDLEEVPKKKIKTMKKASIRKKKFKAYPLSIVVHVNNVSEAATLKNGKDSSVAIAKFSIEFFYIPTCNIVTVSGDTDATTRLLSVLIPNDKGIETPNAERLKEYDFSEFECGRPYRWAQSLCGLHFLPPIPNAKESDKLRVFSLGTIIDLLIYKNRASKVLSDELKDLQEKKLPKSPIPTIDTSVIKFAHIVRLHSFVKQTDDRGSLTSENVAIYNAVFKSGNISFQCSIEINESDYPLITPHFFNLEFMKNSAKQTNNFNIPEKLKHLVHDQKALDIRNEQNAYNTDLKSIEYEANVLFPIQYCQIYTQDTIHTSDNHFRLLSHQMAHVVQCLMIYLQVELDGSKNNAAVRPYLRERRGRDHKLPFSYNNKLSLFTQSL